MLLNCIAVASACLHNYDVPCAVTAFYDTDKFMSIIRASLSLPLRCQKLKWDTAVLNGDSLLIDGERDRRLTELHSIFASQTVWLTASVCSISVGL